MKKVFRFKIFNQNFEVIHDFDDSTRLEETLPTNTFIAEFSKESLNSVLQIEIKTITNGYFIYLNNEIERFEKKENPNSVYNSLEGIFYNLLINKSRNFAVVHSGVVTWKNKAIMIVGKSGSGKSTLTTEFIKQGATYYSDEYAIIDKDGEVHAYPRLISLITNTENIHVKDTFIAQDFGAKKNTELKSVPVSLILFVKYDQNSKLWKPNKLGIGRTVLGLLDNSFTTLLTAEEVLIRYSNLAKSCITLKGTRGDGHAFVKRIISFLESKNY